MIPNQKKSVGLTAFWSLFTFPFGGVGITPPPSNFRFRSGSSTGTINGGWGISNSSDGLLSVTRREKYLAFDSSEGWSRDISGAMNSDPGNKVRDSS